MTAKGRPIGGFRRLSALAAVLIFGLAGTPALAAPVATAARLGEHTGHTRFVLELDQAVDYRVFTLKDPYRIVVEMPEVEWRLPATAGIKGGGLIKSYRYGDFGRKHARIVLDLSGPAKLSTHFMMPAEGGAPNRLVLDIVPASDDEFAVAAGWPMEKPEAVKAAPAKAEARPIKRDDGRFTIVLDAGHGGVDPGATSPAGLQEKDIVLQMARAVETELVKRRAYTVVLVRDGDDFLTLKDRVKVTRAAKADLFISIHADSVDGGALKGASVYTLSERASDQEAADLAHSENAADVIQGVDLSGENDEVTNILIDLALRETKNRSVSFGQMLLPEIGKHTTLVDGQLRFAGFRVLKAPDVPSVLIELGFLSNSAEEERLSSPRWRKGMARAIARGVDVYYERMSSIADSGGLGAH